MWCAVKTWSGEDKADDELAGFRSDTHLCWYGEAKTETHRLPEREEDDHFQREEFACRFMNGKVLAHFGEEIDQTEHGDEDGQQTQDLHPKMRKTRTHTL